MTPATLTNFRTKSTFFQLFILSNFLCLSQFIFNDLTPLLHQVVPLILWSCLAEFAWALLFIYIKAVIVIQLRFITMVSRKRRKFLLVQRIIFGCILVYLRSKCVLVNEIDWSLIISSIIMRQNLPLRPISPNFRISIVQRLLSRIFLVDSFRILLNMILSKSWYKFEDRPRFFAICEVFVYNLNVGHLRGCVIGRR